MTRYTMDEDGNRIERPDINIALWPQIQRHAWYCTQCNMYLKLYPISLDQQPTHWSCSNCKKNITITERDAVFEAHIQLAKDKYELKTLEYDKEDRSWKLESALFISSNDSGIGAKRKVIGPTEREEILTKLQKVIQGELHISFESFSEFFNTE